MIYKLDSLANKNVLDTNICLLNKETFLNPELTLLSIIINVFY